MTTEYDTVTKIMSLTGDKLPIIRNAVSVESNKNAIRLGRGWTTAASLSSVPLDTSDSASRALISLIRGSS